MLSLSWLAFACSDVPERAAPREERRLLEEVGGQIPTERRGERERERSGGPEDDGPLQEVSVGKDGNGEERTFALHVPKQPADGLLPAVFAFHGGKGTTSRDIARFWRPWFDRGFLVVLPNGQLQNPRDGAWEDHAQDGKQVEVVQKIVDRIVKDFRADPAQLYVTGFSSGAHIVNQLACRKPDLFAGFGRTGRTLLESTRALCSNPTTRPQMMILGTKDEGAPESGRTDPNTGKVHELTAEAAWDFWLDGAKCSGKPDEERQPDTDPRCEVELRTWSKCTDRGKMRYVKVVGGEHEWFSPDSPGTSCREMDTSAQFLRFFQEAGGLRDVRL